MEQKIYETLIDKMPRPLVDITTDYTINPYPHISKIVVEDITIPKDAPELEERWAKKIFLHMDPHYELFKFYSDTNASPEPNPEGYQDIFDKVSGIMNKFLTVDMSYTPSWYNHIIGSNAYNSNDLVEMVIELIEAYLQDKEEILQRHKERQMVKNSRGMVRPPYPKSKPPPVPLKNN